jgi:hypothetical protein
VWIDPAWRGVQVIPRLAASVLGVERELVSAATNALLTSRLPYDRETLNGWEMCISSDDQPTVTSPDNRVFTVRFHVDLEEMPDA